MSADDSESGRPAQVCEARYIGTVLQIRPTNRPDAFVQSDLSVELGAMR